MHVTTWMNLTIIMLSEKKLAKALHGTYIIQLVSNSRKCKPVAMV